MGMRVERTRTRWQLTPSRLLVSITLSTRDASSAPLYTRLASRFTFLSDLPSMCCVLMVLPTNTVPGVSRAFRSIVPTSSSAL